MRGSSFYENGRLGRRDVDRNYVHHRQMLDQIRSRQKSQMRKYIYHLSLSNTFVFIVNAQGLKAVEIRPGTKSAVRVGHNKNRMSQQDAITASTTK